MDLASCHPSGAYNFEVALRFFKKSMHPWRGQAEFGISGLHRHVDEIWALLGYYAASGGDPLPTFRDNLSVQSSRVKESKF